jgi:hypothetical protein
LGLVGSGHAAALLAKQPQLVTPVLQVVQRMLKRHLIDRTGLETGEGHHDGATHLMM